MRILTVILLILSINAYGQLITSTSTPANLVQNVLLGTGVQISNINYVGSPNSIGYFDGSNTNIGLNDGVILTTGTVLNTPAGPHGPNNQASAGEDLQSGGFTKLDALVNGSSTFDATILEFDFIPFSDTVKFNYVFASEEYPEFVNSEFNDVFAFFISGPGIAGGEKNMAIIPGTTLPVAINNVNNGLNNNGNCMNCAYYVNNGNGSTFPQNSSNQFVQYDGFTTPLQAISEVQCGETYHLIIALADVGDGLYDSGIFLEANSLSSESPVTIDYDLSDLAFGASNIMAEGCVDATFTIERHGYRINQAETITIVTSGSAIEGTDYTNVPTQINFAAGQATQTFTFSALQDGLAEGQENIILEFFIEDACGNNNAQSFEIFINDLENVEVTVDDQQVVCPGELVQLTANASGGGGSYNYLWSTGETTQSIVVSPTTTTTYSVEVTDDCLEQTAQTTATVTVPSYPPLEIDASADIVEQCPFVPYSIAANVTGGAGGYQFVWTSSLDGQVGNMDSLDILPAATTQYVIVATDQCGTVVTDTVDVTILSPPLVVTTNNPPEICPGESVTLNAAATGGFGDYYFYWPALDDSSATVTVNPLNTTTYEVIVYDDCGTFTVSEFVQVTVVKPDVDFAISSTTLFEGLPITFQNLTQNAAYYLWDFGDGNGSSMVHPNNTYLEPGSYTVQLIAEDLKGCIDSISKPITILPEFYLYIPNTFTPDGDRYNNYFRVEAVNVIEFSIGIYNRWGELIFTSEDVDFMWDGTNSRGVIVKDGTYIYKVKYKSINNDEEIITGHINVLK